MNLGKSIYVYKHDNYLDVLVYESLLLCVHETRIKLLNTLRFDLFDTSFQFASFTQNNSLHLHFTIIIYNKLERAVSILV